MRKREEKGRKSMKERGKKGDERKKGYGGESDVEDANGKEEREGLKTGRRKGK